MTDLFSDQTESLSPREQWMRAQGVTVRETCGHEGRGEQERWAATDGRLTCHAPERNQAVAMLAQRLWTEFGIKPWNLK